MLAPDRFKRKLLAPLAALLSAALMCAALLLAATPAQAAPGALYVLVTGNQPGHRDALGTAIAAEPGIGLVSAFNTSTGTPTPAALANYDLVVSIGDDAYSNPTLWGDRLADYIDGGGAVLQAAYDNWDNAGAAPSGRFAADGYPPLLNGDNQNDVVTLGTILDPTHPLMQGLGTGMIPSGDNTNTALAPGATLIAKWSDDRNAIALKGRVAAISASPGEENSIPGIARLAVNAGNYFWSRSVTVTKPGTGLGSVTSTPTGIACGTTCSARFLFGSTPALTATPAPDSVFTGWTGACSGTGACAPTIAGPDLNVGAVFDLAGFASNTRVTLSPLSTKIARSGKLKVRVRNSNGFSVTGKVSARTASKVRTTRLRYVNLKSKTIALNANATRTVVLKLPKALQAIVTDKGKLKLLVSAKIKSPAGKSRTIKKRVTVKPKS